VKKLSILVLLLLLAVACGADNNGALGGVPAPPPGAQEVPQDVLPFDEATVAESFRASMAVNTVHVRVYALPAATAFAQVEAYYQDLLSGGWQAQETEALRQGRAEGRQAAIWGNDEAGEILSIQYVPTGQGNLLIVLYASTS
jgi:hypothetical protein